jgi:NADH dehydrogenase
MRVAVAGGSGFIGRHVVEALHAAGHEVIVLARRPGPSGTVVDLARQDVPSDALAGCTAIVNLVGIKAGRREDFERAHVGAVQRLVRAARAAGITRLLHVSVVDIPGSSTDYAETKRAGEREARDSGLDVTILRPSLVVGAGDDALRNTIALVKALPWIVVPRPQPGWLALVRVQDVADAIARALVEPAAVGATYDLVGPQRMTMAQLAGHIGRVLRLRTRAITLPMALLRPGAAVLEGLGSTLVTRSQLDLLARGLDGDATAAVGDLGWHPEAVDDATIRDLARAVRAPSLRIFPDPAHQEAAAAWSDAASSTRWFLPLALAAMLLSPWWWPSVWLRMAVVETALSVIALRFVPLPWGSLLRPRAWAVGVGLAAAVVMYVGGALVFAGLAAVHPALAAQTASVLAWTEQLPVSVQLPALLLIVAAEDTVWRAAVTLPLADRVGPAGAAAISALAFSLAHLTSGPPILWVAAALAGFAWSVLLLRTRNLWSVVVCHAAWDIAVAYVRPYV